MTTHHAQHRAATVSAPAAEHGADVASTTIETPSVKPGPTVADPVEPAPPSPLPDHSPRGGDRAPAVQVAVDNTHCAVFGICVQEAPAVFDLGVDGRLRYDARPAPADTARVRQAARVCPMQAITVTGRR